MEPNQTPRPDPFTPAPSGPERPGQPRPSQPGGGASLFGTAAADATGAPGVPRNPRNARAPRADDRAGTPSTVYTAGSGATGGAHPDALGAYPPGSGGPGSPGGSGNSSTPPRPPVPPKKRRRLPFILGGAALLLAAAGVALALVLFRGGAGLVPSAETEDGIPPDATFTLSLGKPAQDLDALTASIAIEPDTPFTLAPLDEEAGTYTLAPGRLFAPGADVSIKVGDKRPFTFKVQNRLMLAGTWPADGSALVPTTSGVEFAFNAGDIDMLTFRVGFSINPPVAGGFAAAEGRYIFYPAEPMQPGTEYTVALSGDVATQGGAKMDGPAGLTFTTQTAEDENSGYVQRQFQLFGNGFSVNALTSEVPVYLAYLVPELTEAASAEGGGTVDVEVYAFPGAQAYSDQLSQNLGRGDDVEVRIDTGGLTQVAGFTVTPTLVAPDSDGYFAQGRHLIAFPEPMPKGWYAVQLTYSGGGQSVTRQQFLQVSDVSLFTMWSGQNMLAWVNDAATGQPVKGAVVSLSGGFTGSAATGTDGTATLADGRPPISRQGGRFGDLITVENGDDTFVDINNYYYYDHGGPGGATARSYISTLFTDRPVYRTTDTLQAWGVLRPRDDAATPKPTTARLVVGTYQADITETKVTINADGTYTAQLALEGLSATGATVKLMLDDATVISEYVTIKDFKKPIYTATAETDKPIYMLGADQAATVTAQVTLFDGTPAPNVDLSLHADSTGLSVSPEAGVTDDQGRFGATLELLDRVNSWYPQSLYYSFSSTSAQDEYLTFGGRVLLVGRDLMLRGRPAENNTQALDITTHRVDITGVSPPNAAYGYTYPDHEALQGAAVDTTVSYQVHHVYYTKEVTGTYYDFINRTTAETYTYQRHDEVVDTGTIGTTGGAATLTGLPEPDGENAYYVALSATDSLGRPVEATAWLSGDTFRAGYNSDGYQRYSLDRRTDPTGASVSEGGGDYILNWSASRFADGEDVSFYLALNEEELTDMPGRLLTTVVKDAFTGTTVSESPQLSLPFAEQLLPNYTLTGAYFDGKHIFQLENTIMSFDPSARALDITLTPDRDSYAPAEAVKVTAQVTEAATGKPAEDVALVLAVVDEAVFAVAEQYVDVLDQYYRQMYYPEVFKYVSYPDNGLPSSAEKGGGGGGDTRSDFKDTAGFLTGATNASGQAEFSFTLPDDITTWRLTAVAVGQSGTAGNNTGAVVSTKPFFVAPVVNTTLLAGDSCAVGLYGAGTGVAPADETAYTVTLKGNGVEQLLTTASALRTYAAVDFGLLPIGEYTVTVAGACGAHQDTVELPVSVVAGGVEVPTTTTFNLADGIDVDPLRQPVSVVFYGEGGRSVSTLLRTLAQGSTGSRADMRLARAYVAALMQQRGDGWYDADALEQDLSDIDGRRALQLQPYAEADLALSVRAHLAAPQLVSDAFLQTSFGPEGSPNSTSATMGHLARALANMPLGVDLQALARDETQGLADRLTAALALALTGSADTARQIYDELVPPKLTGTTGVSGAELLSVSADMFFTENQNTAAASWLATTLKTPEAEGLVLQLAEKGSEYEPYLLEQMYYLTTFGPGGSAQAAFTYSKGGGAHTQQIDGDPVTLSFTREELAQANFTVTTGPVYADVYYVASPAALAGGERRLGLTKTVTPVDGSTGPGALVRVTLTPDFSGLDIGVGARTLTIDDYIPSGLRYESSPYGATYYGYYTSATDAGWVLSSRQGQRLQFTVYGLLGNTEIDPIVYYARVATPGDYVIESAYISSASGASWGATERDVFHAEE